MSIWPKAPLGNLCYSIVDGDHQSLPLAETGVPFITISDISNNRIGFTHARYVPHDYYDKLDPSRRPEKGAVLYSVKGSFGIPVYVDFDDPFTFQRDIAILKCKPVLNSHYLYYVLKSPEYYRLADLLAIGSAQRALTLKTLKSIEVSVPPRETQDRIADALSAYDALIEINQRQIKLLEEAAQRLYREWFVDLRFPGHEDVPVVDGVPEGWKRCILGDLFTVVRGKSYSSAEISGKDGLLMVNLSNIRPFGGYNRQQEKIFNGKYKQEQLVSAHDLIMGVTDMTQEKRTVGRVALVPNLHAEAIISMDLIKLIPREGSTLFFYALLLFGNYSELVSRFSNGTNVLHLRPEVLNMVDAILPSKLLQEKFVTRFTAIVDRIDALQDEIIYAAEARDRLLPKLMSGEIEV